MTFYFILFTKNVIKLMYIKKKKIPTFYLEILMFKDYNL